MGNKDRHIKALAAMSRTDEHELLLEMLDYYGAKGLYELTEKQTEDFLNMKLEELYRGKKKSAD